MEDFKKEQEIFQGDENMLISLLHQPTSSENVQTADLVPNELTPAATPQSSSLSENVQTAALVPNELTPAPTPQSSSSSENDQTTALVLDELTPASTPQSSSSENIQKFELKPDEIARIPSNRGRNNKLYLNGFTYLLDKKHGAREYHKCTE